MEFGLIRLPNAVPLARRLAREWFAHWGVPEDVQEAAELVTSELVTNAVVQDQGRTITVRLRWGGLTGFVEVWDANPKPPALAVADEWDTGGRGLFIVGAYATRWDCYPSQGGKVVWAELGATRQVGT